MVRECDDAEMVPQKGRWQQPCHIDRDFGIKTGEACIGWVSLPEGYRGAGISRFCSAVHAIAMTEPGTGLDLQSIKTTERMHNIGKLADLVMVIQTDSTQGAKALSLMVIGPENNNGFARGGTLDKIALKRQNTSEVFFDNRRIGPECLLDGQEGQGFWPQAR